MSSWYLPHPEQKHMDQAWEKNPLAKKFVDRLNTTVGVEEQKREFMDDYTPEENARYRAQEWAYRLRLEARIYALWLQHLDEMERHRQAMIRHNEQAWLVYRNVLAAHGRGRKTARITDLMGDTP